MKLVIKPGTILLRITAAACGKPLVGPQNKTCGSNESALARGIPHAPPGQRLKTAL